MENKKYELADETMEYWGHTLHRIRALKNFNDVSKGDLGGFIESEDNLSQDGLCWVGDEACVFDNAKVYGDAQVTGNAFVRGNAEVYDFAEVYGDAEVHGNAKVCGSAEVFDEAEVYGRAIIFGDAIICGDARVNERVSDGRMEGKEDIDLD